MKRIIPLLCVLMIVCGCMASRTGGDAVLSIRLTGADKSGDNIAVSREGMRTVVDVHSTSGIGRAEISPVDGRWQKPLILRLHLRGLESLNVSNGKFAINSSVLSRPPYKQLCELCPVGGRTGSSLEEVSPFWIHLQLENIKQPGHRVIPLENGYFEVSLPDALFDGDTDTVFLQWIDFFRR